jgi:hypothetical protein
MIEITNDPAFRPGYRTQWHCSRCNQPVPDERHYDVDGVQEVLHSSDLVHGAAIVARTSRCRLVITVLAAALVGAFTVGSVDRMPPLHLATPFDDAVMAAGSTAASPSSAVPASKSAFIACLPTGFPDDPD